MLVQKYNGTPNVEKRYELVREGYQKLTAAGIALAFFCGLLFAFILVHESYKVELNQTRNDLSACQLSNYKFNKEAMVQDLICLEPLCLDNSYEPE